MIVVIMDPYSGVRLFSTYLMTTFSSKTMFLIFNASYRRLTSLRKVSISPFAVEREVLKNSFIRINSVLKPLGE